MIMRSTNDENHWTRSYISISAHQRISWSNLIWISTMVTDTQEIVLQWRPPSHVIGVDTAVGYQLKLTLSSIYNDLHNVQRVALRLSLHNWWWWCQRWRCPPPAMDRWSVYFKLAINSIYMIRLIPHKNWPSSFNKQTARLSSAR